MFGFEEVALLLRFIISNSRRGQTAFDLNTIQDLLSDFDMDEIDL